MPAEITPIPFVSYSLDLAPEGTYTVLEPAEPTAHRVQEPTGQVIAVPCADSTQPLTAEALAEHLENPPAFAPAPSSLSPLQVLGRLTQAEEAALTTSTDLAVSIVRQRLIAASEIRADDPRTAEGAAILVAKGIITEQRAAEIFPI